MADREYVQSFFLRQPNGAVRLRIRFDPQLASLIEDAAGDADLLDWMRDVLRDAATKAADEIRRQQPVIGPPTEEVGHEQLGS